MCKINNRTNNLALLCLKRNKDAYIDITRKEEQQILLKTATDTNESIAAFISLYIFASMAY